LRKFAGIIFAALLIATLAISCAEDKGTGQVVDEYFAAVWHFSNMPDLGSDFVYQAWYFDQDTTPYSLGVISVTDSVVVTLGIDFRDVLAFAVSIEPTPGPSGTPSGTYALHNYMAVSNTAYQQDVSFPYEGLFLDADSTNGQYVLMTVTDGDSSLNESCGAWWVIWDSTLVVDTTGPGPWDSTWVLDMQPGLTLPELSGWVYEGWVAADTGTAPDTAVAHLSMGKFALTDSLDWANPYILAVDPPPNYPGEEFLDNAPGSVTFPRSLFGLTYTVTVEPEPDTDTLAMFPVHVFNGTFADSTWNFMDATRNLNYPISNIVPVQTND
jgi:hypothetical protein